MNLSRFCFLIIEIAVVSGAAVWSLAKLVALRRMTGGYGLSDALSAGAIGGLIGLVAGIGVCALRDGAAHAGGGVAWLTRSFAFGGLAILEGAAVGAAVAFALVRFQPQPGTRPTDDDG